MVEKEIDYEASNPFQNQGYSAIQAFHASKTCGTNHETAEDGVKGPSFAHQIGQS